MTGTAATPDAGSPESAAAPPRTPAHRPRGRWRETVPAAALALGGGALVALSLPPWGFWPLALVGVAVADVALGRAPSPRRRFAVGWWFGAGWMFLGMGWMVQLTAPGYVVAAAIFAGFHGLATLASPSGRWSVIARPAMRALVEALRFSFPFGGVPLASLGISQVGGPLGGVARVGGVILIGWVVFQAAAIVVEVAARLPGRLVPRRSPERSGPDVPALVALAAAVAVVAVVALASVAPRGVDSGATRRVAIVQGGGRQGTSALEVPPRLVTDRHLEATASIAADRGLDLVVWPENTIDVEEYRRSPVAPLVSAQAERLGVPITLGLTEDVVVDGRRRFTNAQVVVAADGSVVDRYDKVRRVPFGEYVPLRSLLERVTSAVDRVGDAVPGRTPAVLELPSGDRLGVVISWEVFFGGRAREGVRLGAEAIVNPTNGASYTGTIVQTQQVASSRLRAIETGRWVVQAAPTGFSAFVSPDGDVVERSSQREQVVLVRQIALRTGTTWYVRLGDGPVIGALIVVALGAVVAEAAARRRRGATGSWAPADELTPRRRG
ncbi:apolipoprotein N-acyltransferase [Ilumatobacter sp.]|uniref:apolipoprotein N-acyltransferase n=1 Tax=Ilumatobacter sp. TaxID=1967498 RepID=UPI003B52205F